MPNVRRRKARRKAAVTSTQHGKKLRKKNKDKIHISEKCIRDRWDKKKSVRQNLSSLGLTVDANVAVPLITRKTSEEIASVQSTSNSTDLLAELEALSQQPPRKRKVSHITLGDAKFLVTLIHAHGTHYKKMARDKRNYDQLTESQLRKRCDELRRSAFSYLLEEEEDS